jgi:predicted ATPase/DNA-binding winged helix-turn-helix (wHTH) protein
MMGPEARTADVLSFGPFSLVASERLLTKEGAPVKLGARALDTLIALVSHPNEVVSKKDLLAQVWPDVTVDEGSLRFHIASLRKALGEGKDGARYIATAAGRGYCFVAPISRSSGSAGGHPQVAADFPHANLPNRLIRMVGRDDDVLTLSNQLTATRFVTIVGAGGVGKTTVAVAVGHDLIEAFSGAVLFVDLGMLNDPYLAPTAVASMLGLSVRSDNATPAVIAYLRDKRILLIIDTCEHLVEAVAALASSIFTAAPQVHILATSREALRVEGEHVYRLAPLASPPNDPRLTAALAQTFPATQLFVERVAASGARLDFSDADAAIVASICRKLDGVALAIELAAGRVVAYGLHQTAELLDQRLALLWLGQRTAPLRQQTLQAALDWSYQLLSALERVVLRRLAVFVGHFTIDAALAVATSATVDRGVIFGAIDSLIAKSLVATRPIGAMMRYQLLDTTRAYALDISTDVAELADLAVRHATYYRKWLEESGADWPTLSSGAERAPHFAAINNVRAALEWCFGVDGNVEIGVGLASAAVPIFLAMSLLTECHRWSERAILALDDATRGGREEMHLQAALGMSLMFTRGSGEGVRVALNRSLAIAEEQDDALTQLKLFGPLRMFHSRIGDFKTALHYAKRGAAVSKTVADPAALTLAHSMLGMSLYLTGDVSGARAELEAALEFGPSSLRIATSHLGFDGHNMAGVTLGKILWLQGHPDQAVERARQTVKDAASIGHPVTLSVALVWAVLVFLATGDLESAEEHIDWFIANAEIHSLEPYLAVGRGFKGQLAFHRGDARGGVEYLQSCLKELHALRYELLTTPFNISLVQGFVAIGQLAEGIALVEETIRLVEENGDAAYMPELLRVKGNALLLMPEPMEDKAEECFTQSLEFSRRQATLAWELRTAIDLATLLARRGRRDRARALLRPVLERFTEGRDSADLKAAEHLLAILG